MQLTEFARAVTGAAPAGGARAREGPAQEEERQREEEAGDGSPYDSHFDHHCE